MLYPDELQALHCDKAFRQCDPTILLRYPHEFGRGREIRTPDILLPKQARYQTALYPAIRSTRIPCNKVGDNTHQATKGQLYTPLVHGVEPCDHGRVF